MGINIQLGSFCSWNALQKKYNIKTQIKLAVKIRVFQLIKPSKR